MKAVKAVLLRVERRYHLFRGIRRFRRAWLAGDISFEAVVEIWIGWGNTGYSAPPELLYELALRAATLSDRAIVECGSGVSTLLLGLMAERTRARVVALESDAAWCEALRRRLSSLVRAPVEIRYAALTPYGEFDFYSQDAIPDAKQIGMLVCDGPPGDSRGGRIGALRQLGPELARNAIIFIDDTNREPEHDMAVAWAQQFGLRRDRFQSRSDHAFDVLVAD